MRYKKPKICGHCIFFVGDKDFGFCWRNEDEPKARYYNEVACNLGKKA